MAKTAIIYVLILTYITSEGVYSEDIPSCDNDIYCKGQLLEVVQKANIFNDSKSFVDQRMLYDQKTILNNFETLMNESNNKPTRSAIQTFVKNNFADGNELISWTLPDYKENPKFLERITNVTLKKFAQDIVKIWPTLARQIKPDVYKNPDKYSIIPLPNGFVVPGGRFKEMYYWDTYWVIEGLLISEMPNTVKNILENYFYLIKNFGFIPNGARVYYLNRSQLPLLTSMVSLYIKATNNLDWLRENIYILESELNFFLQNRTISLQVDNELYTLARYNVNSSSPRPESYSQDLVTCAPLKDEEKIKNCYSNLKSAAESGMDFSYRWVFDKNGGNDANKTQMQTNRVIPVDLNVVLAKSFKELALLFKQLGSLKKYNYWNMKFNKWQLAIHQVLYNEDKGIWFDYDIELGKHRELFYPTNIMPLWGEIYDPETAQILGKNAYQYLVDENILQYFGGIPSSLNNTGEQWDFPSAWAPLQSFVIQGLRKSSYGKAQKLAETFARRWVDSNLLAYQRTGKLYEKYDATRPGQEGGGGEYKVQDGFGWTNGVVLELIRDFLSN